MVERNNKNVRVRFAPSPTGYLHIGSARTALYNYLFARKNMGTFILRIEDTDVQRSSTEFENSIKEDLDWLGIGWDEGPEKEGVFGPYRQSSRLEIYREYTGRLLGEGKAYWCFCSPEELEFRRQEQLKSGMVPRYDGRCSKLTESEREELRNKGLSAALRFRVPREPCVVNDIIRGRVEFAAGEIGDFVIQRSGGIPAYNLVAVVDDHLMQVTHVIRGEDHLSNTPRQMMLYKALKMPLPDFAHLPMILGTDKKMLSKRHGSVSIRQYREEGFLAEAVINFIANLGYHFKGNGRLKVSELIEEFCLERVSRSPAIFDLSKLKWFNKNYIRKNDIKEIFKLSIPFLEKAGFNISGRRIQDEGWMSKIFDSIRGEIEVLSEIPGHIRFYFEEFKITNEMLEQISKKSNEYLVVLKAFIDRIHKEEELTEEASHSLIQFLKNDTGLEGKALLMPIRVALTGDFRGPELVVIITLLGKDKCIQRAENLIKYLGEKL